MVVRPAHVGQEGQAIVETAIAFPLLIIVIMALVQFALIVHAQHVVTGAVQDGARVAAAEDRTLDDGVMRTQSLLQAGLGANASMIAVTATGGADAVVIEAQGGMRLLIPWVADATVPLHARAMVAREGFIAGPGR